jgi:2-polyprenyl-3-methyl-5-hydroxy-6-metoxy-1,4-benzoquinol methylase
MKSSPKDSEEGQKHFESWVGGESILRNTFNITTRSFKEQFDVIICNFVLCHCVDSTELTLALDKLSRNTDCCFIFPCLECI